jgi:hypothetical protein
MSLMYVVSFLTASLAALRMNQDLGFRRRSMARLRSVLSRLFPVRAPSNLMLQKAGARLWMPHLHHLGLLMLTAFLLRAGQLTVRFRWVPPKGLYPGMVLYNLWLPLPPAVHRAVPGRGAAVRGDRITDSSWLLEPAAMVFMAGNGC